LYVVFILVRQRDGTVISSVGQANTLSN